MSNASDLAHTKIENFFKDKPLRKYKKDSFLLEPGDEVTHIFYLKKGVVRQFDVSPQGNELVVNVFKTGTFFPMNHIFIKKDNEYFFQAFSDVGVSIAEVDTVLKEIANDKDVLTDLLTRVYRGTDGLLRRMVHLMGGNVKTRFIQELIIQADRFGEENQQITIPLTITELAARSGMTRETASRVTSELRKKNLVKVGNKKVKILNIDKLKKELDQEFSVSKT